MRSTTRPVLGIDVGTTSVSVVVLDPADGKSIVTRTVQHSADLCSNGHDESLQNAEVLLSAVDDAVSELIERFPNIAGIGITGQMHGIVLTDLAGNAVSPIYTWLDGRLNRSDPDGIPYSERLQNDTGTVVPSGFGLGTVYQLARSGSIPPEARRVMTAPDFVATRLVSLQSAIPDDRKSIDHFTSASMAHSIGFFDAETGEFSHVTSQFLGDIVLPRVKPSGTILGTTYRGIPVFLPEGDNQTSFLGSVRDPERAVSVNIGTSGQISLMISGEVHQTIPEGLESRPFFGVGTLLVGASLTGGKSFEVLATLISDVSGKTGRQTTDPYSVFEKISKPAHGSELRIDTRFNGSRTDAHVRGSISGISLSNFDVSHLYWGIAEGVIRELVDMIGSYSRIVQNENGYVAISGNALERSTAMQHYLAQYLGAPLRRSLGSEAAARGAAILATAALEGDCEMIFDVSRRTIRYTDESVTS